MGDLVICIPIRADEGTRLDDLRNSLGIIIANDYTPAGCLYTSKDYISVLFVTPWNGLDIMPMLMCELRVMS